MKRQLIILLIILVSCKDKSFVSRYTPYVKTLPPTYDHQDVTLRGELLDLGFAFAGNHGFVWNSTSDSLVIGSANLIALGYRNKAGSFQAPITVGINAGESYYYRAFAIGPVNTVYSEIEVFIPLFTLLDISLSEGLNAHYPFNKSHADVSGNDYHGTKIGSPFYENDRSGVGSSAIFFDGIDDAILLPTGVFNLARSVSFWFQPKTAISDTISGNKCMLGRNSIGPFRPFFIGFTAEEGNKGKIEFNTEGLDGTIATIRSDNNTWLRDDWFHFVCILDPDDGMKMFINGALQQDSYPHFSPIPGSNNIAAVAAWGNLDILHFNGAIDDLRVYTRALSNEEVANLSGN